VLEGSKLPEPAHPLDFGIRERRKVCSWRGNAMEVAPIAGSAVTRRRDCEWRRAETPAASWAKPVTSRNAIDVLIALAS
jgi:hypothetical protein